MKATRLEHGGGLGEGQRKKARPVSTREPIYLLLRTSKAKGRYALDRPEQAEKVDSIIEKQAKACRVTVLEFQNHGSSLHFLIRVSSRAGYLRFIRSVSGLISRQVTGAERGPTASSRLATQTGAKRANGLMAANARTVSSTRATAIRRAKAKVAKRKFWDSLPYSRIATGAKTIVAAQRLIDEDVKLALGLLINATSRAATLRRSKSKRQA